ncbi:MAG: DUF2851 family protein [Firmicutes bacterium]|nr:DUF2851 family protein [Bacillota bacterium]MCM1401543.1 DUF2851 family protein [Bacteroides sp.]MCM1476589.1 DUF2851 family protein [Bacteroides sp.]
MERLMQYVWQHRLWLQHNMATVDGKRVNIIDPGTLNTGSGPDFFNAKIIIDGHLWAGDVEIHVKASDWHRHGHDGNPAYDSVILHVVDRDDTIIHRINGEPIPQMRMPCEPSLHQHYSQLVGRSDIALPCSGYIADISPLHLGSWIDSLAFERLYNKAEHIDQLRERFCGDWESTAYVTLARSLGFGINGDPFERLALSLPLIFIGKHADSLTSIEALLFGQSGLIDSNMKVFGDYVERLRREYEFLAHKFGLRRPEGLLWKMARMRPANFPHRRIATLAAMLAGGFRMMSRILEVASLDDAVNLFSPQLSTYWDNHYNFGPGTGGKTSPLSRSSVAGLTINAVIPLQLAYALHHGHEDMTDRCINLLQSLPPERNTIVEMFVRAGIKAPDSFTTQALIQLRRNYCEQHKCLFCRIGHRMLATKARRTN